MALDPSTIFAQMNPQAFNQAEGAQADIATKQAALPGVRAESQIKQASVPYAIQGAQLDNAIKQNQIGIQLLSSAVDQPSYDGALKAAQKYGIDTTRFPPNYDPAVVRQMTYGALTAKDKLDMMFKTQSANLDQAKFSAEYPNASGSMNGGTLGSPAPTTPNTITRPASPPQSGNVADNPNGTINMAPKPIDGDEPAVSISATPTQGMPVQGPQPSAQGQASLAAQQGVQQYAQNDGFQPQYNAKGEPVKGVNEGTQLFKNSQGQIQERVPSSNSIFNPNTPANLHGDDYIKTLNPTQAAYIKSIANGELQIPTPRGKAESAQLEDLNAAVKQYDPSFYSGRKSALDSFRGGDDGKQIATFSKGIEHLDTLGQLAGQLNNTSSPAYNTLANLVSKQTGSAKVTNFDAAKNIVGQELDKAIAGVGNTTITGSKEAKEQLAAASSPEQLQGAIQTIQNLMGGQLTGLAQSYKNSVGGDGFVNLLTPKAAQVFQNYETGKTSPSKQSISEGATATNSMGHKITFRGGKWQ